MKLFPAKLRKPAHAPRQVLQASVVRRSARAASIEEEEEPTTSFTTALVVVVILHLVAAGGVYMFESIKTHHPNAFEGNRSAVAAAKAAMAAPAPSATAAPVASAPAAAHSKSAETTAAVETPKKSASAAASTMASTASAEVKDSGTTYTVIKGDTMVSISRRLHVSQDDLLKLNRIEDPKRLRIGQKLRVPVKLRASN